MARLAGADPDLAQVLRELRQAENRSQEALAHDAGLTVTSLGRIERASVNPSWTTVRRIADALGVSLAELGREIDLRRRDRD